VPQLTQKDSTKLLDWMTFLGLRSRMLAKGFGLSPNAIDAAGAKGCRRSRWLPALSQLIAVPVEILLDTSRGPGREGVPIASATSHSGYSDALQSVYTSINVINHLA
jgi:hypothetical protein